MQKYYEVKKDNFLVTTDPNKINMQSVYEHLAKAHWANKRSKELIEKSFKNSLCFSLLDNDKHIGIARVITDYATFAYLCDVYIDETYRGQKLGEFLIKSVVEYEELKNLRRFLLYTTNAKEFYKKFGFHELINKDNFLEIFNDV
ncbi:MAG: hypothetical protein PWP46_1891 [Fusobacteriaceae bacterium]|nr:acetyltransferase family protein [Fusobacteriales bacterium]MDN5305005.1 hypothetical protein [Fusobacteriaceae bacterium]